MESADLPSCASLSRASMIDVAQLASADRLVMGSFAGSEEDLRITLRVLDVRNMKLGAELSVSGPVASLPRMENELAWILLSKSGLNQIYSRVKFQERARAIPNHAFAAFVQSLNQSDPVEQARLLSMATESYEDFPEAHSALGQYYFEQGECEQSIRHLEKASALHEKLAENQFRLGSCYMKTGDIQGAIRSFSGMLTLVSSPQALNNLGVAYLRKGDYLQAAQNLVEAGRSAHSEPTILANLALVRHLQGEDNAAKAILEESAKAHPERALIQFLLAVVLKTMGEQAQADSALGQARLLGFDPDKAAAEDPRSWARPFTTWTGRPSQ